MTGKREDSRMWFVSWTGGHEKIGRRKNTIGVRTQFPRFSKSKPIDLQTRKG